MDLFAQKVKSQNKAKKRKLIGSLFGARIKPSIASKDYLERYVELSNLRQGLVSSTKKMRSVDSRIRKISGSQNWQGNEGEAPGLRRKLEFWKTLHNTILSEIRKIAGKE